MTPHNVNDEDKKLRTALVDYLDRPRTHAPLKKAVADMPEEAMNEKLPNVPHTAWALLEHIRITAHDMLEFVRNPEYEALDWPKDYWPHDGEKATKKTWDESVAACERDRLEFRKIVMDEKTALLTPIPWGEGQTVLREVMQMVDHTGYHVGELILLRRALGEWDDK